VQTGRIMGGTRPSDRLRFVLFFIERKRNVDSRRSEPARRVVGPPGRSW
jgi:hypothetical protein